MELIEPQYSAAVTEPYARQLPDCIFCADCGHCKRGSWADIVCLACMQVTDIRRQANEALQQARAEIAEADRAAANAHKQARTQCFAYADPQALEKRSQPIKS